MRTISLSSSSRVVTLLQMARATQWLLMEQAIVTLGIPAGSVAEFAAAVFDLSAVINTPTPAST